MTRLNIEIQDHNIAEKILWMLQHFKDEGVYIQKFDSNDEIKQSIKTSLVELSEIQEGKRKPQLAKDFLNEL